MITRQKLREYNKNKRNNNEFDLFNKKFRISL